MKGNKLFIYLILVVFALVVLGIFFIYRSIPDSETPEQSLTRKEYSENDRFRNLVVRFIRGVAEAHLVDSSEPARWAQELEIESDWQTGITLYSHGAIIGEGSSNNELLPLALEEATKKALEGLIKEDIEDARFKVNFFSSPGREFSFIEYNREGKELFANLVILRNLDRELISQKIEQGKDFLFRMEDKDKHGFHKYYNALDDELENRLHTVYSASIIYTFLYVYDFEKDERITNSLSQWGDFLLSMQNKDEGDKRYGAFHYSYYLDTKEKELKFVVGTSALSIFTLLRLYDLTGQDKYLESAKLAGDWLITMQEPEGKVNSYVKYDKGRWLHSKGESILYNGQVLSALSKLYKATGEEKYYNAAEKIAQRFAEKIEQAQGEYLADDYRSENPISSAWAVMSLLDFYRANQNDSYKNIILEYSNRVLERQIKGATDPLNNGRWDKSYSTSGTGWLAEVMVEMYELCKEESRGDCGKYKEGVIRAIRWIIQHTYSEENSFLLKNPERANGGVFWNKENKYVRTDSLCHTLNSYARIMNELDEGLLVLLPEKPLADILDELRSEK